MAADRPHDIVLFGATGFTGGLTAEYLAGAVPKGTRWALAGRNRSKLEGVRSRLAKRKGFEEPGLLEADVTDAHSLARIAESARVLITTVGPYIHYGDPLVGACAEAGTDYVDLTGEPEFVDRCYVRHHTRAEQTGARLVHACGFDSIPHDLGVLYTVRHLPGGVPLKVEGFVRAGGKLSGGTYQSALAGFSRPRQNLDAAKQRKRAEPPRDPSRKVQGIRGRPRHESVADAWVILFPRWIRRSCCAPPARWRATARTSPTATTSRSSACQSQPRAWPGWAASSRSPRSRLRASSCRAV